MLSPVTIGRRLVELPGPLWLDLAALAQIVEHVDHELRVVEVVGGREGQGRVVGSPDFRIGVVEALGAVGLGLEERAVGVEIVEVGEDAALGRAAVARVRDVGDHFAEEAEHHRRLLRRDCVD